MVDMAKVDSTADDLHHVAGKAERCQSLRHIVLPKDDGEGDVAKQRAGFAADRPVHMKSSVHKTLSDRRDGSVLVVLIELDATSEIAA
jgi:hypothetical protein